MFLVMTNPAMTSATASSQYPESRVLIIMTGGTICMRSSPDGLGLVPAKGFLEQAMAPRPSFNDGTKPGGFLNISFSLQKMSEIWEFSMFQD
jgi:hypothetical protein